MVEIIMNLKIKVTDETPLIYIEQLIGDALKEDQNVITFDYTDEERELLG